MNKKDLSCFITRQQKFQVTKEQNLNTLIKENYDDRFAFQPQIGDKSKKIVESSSRLR